MSEAKEIGEDVSWLERAYADLDLLLRDVDRIISPLQEV